MKKIIFLFAFFAVTLSSQAQYIRDHVSIGVGPSFMYMDNSALYRQLNFKLLPAISVDYSRDISNHWDLRGTFGNQWIGTGNGVARNSHSSQRWGREGFPTYFTGSALYADFMPVYQFNPNLPDNHISLFNFYIGLGIGGMIVNRQDETWLAENQYANSSNMETIAYIPGRFGISSNTLQNWDVAAEWTTLFALSSRADGMPSKDKMFYQDAFFQFQLKFKRYLR